MHTSLVARVNTFLLVLVVLMAGSVIAILARGALGGPLDPPGPPASTMHTLADTPPSWDQVLDSANGAPGPTNPPAGCNSDRFKCVMNYQQCGGACINVFPAVLDEETGLAWQRSPDTTALSWTAAVQDCALGHTGNRQGWRLPTLGVLGSLEAGAGPASLPTGNPFADVQSATYWTSTDDADDPATAWTLNPTLGAVGHPVKSSSNDYWCVRGATGNR